MVQISAQGSAPPFDKLRVVRRLEPQREPIMKTVSSQRSAYKTEGRVVLIADG